MHTAKGTSTTTEQAVELSESLPLDMRAEAVERARRTFNPTDPGIDRACVEEASDALKDCDAARSSAVGQVIDLPPGSTHDAGPAGR